MSSKPENQYCKPTNWHPKEFFFEFINSVICRNSSFLGGSVDFAEKKANELRNIYPVEGGMMQAYVLQVKNDFKASASKYTEVFQSLKDIFPDPENCVIELGRDLIFDLGRVSAQYQMESKLGLLFLGSLFKILWVSGQLPVGMGLLLSLKNLPLQE